MSQWPKQDSKSMTEFYGPVGTGQTTLKLPYAMRLTWAPGQKITQITCHSKVADSLRSIFMETLTQYGEGRVVSLGLDRFSGCLNVRKMRGGNAWSIHSWGAAVDLDDERNQLRWNKTRAVFARPEYVPFWSIVAGHGWVSLGQARDFDWMHFQAARL